MTKMLLPVSRSTKQGFAIADAIWDRYPNDCGQCFHCGHKFKPGEKVYLGKPDVDTYEQEQYCNRRCMNEEE